MRRLLLSFLAVWPWSSAYAARATPRLVLPGPAHAALIAPRLSVAVPASPVLAPTAAGLGLPKTPIAAPQGPRAAASAAPAAEPASLPSRGALQSLAGPASAAEQQAADSLGAAFDGTRTRTPAVAAPPEVVTVRSWKQFAAVLRAQLAARGYHKDRVLIREFDPARVPLALKTGSDRDGTSELYDIPEADSSEGERRKRRVAKKRVTYAHMLDLSSDPIRTIPLDKPAEIAFPSADAEALLLRSGDIPIPQAMSVYDPDLLTRAAEVEYWFKGNPRESLLFIIVKP